MNIIRSSRRIQFWLLTTLCVLTIAIMTHPASGQSVRHGKRSASPNAPAWYNSPPTVIDTLVARGKGSSDDEQTAIDKAVAEARSVLATTIDRRWKILMREIETETGVRSPGKTEPVVLEGSTMLLHTLVKKDSVWTAFVLVGVPEASVHTFLLRRLHRDAAWYEKVRTTENVRSFETPAP